MKAIKKSSFLDGYARKYNIIHQRKVMKRITLLLNLALKKTVTDKKIVSKKNNKEDVIWFLGGKEKKI